MTDILLKGNYFKNWHKPSQWYRAKKRNLSQLYPVSVHHKHNGDAEINFESDMGERMSFFLTKEVVDILKRKLQQP